ncbi:unnamed protein product [Menidia menidia]|uniref:(Atlantic silverside) hypothetical protein n=1 Tax=Menidia menidia TaxID=238744 RepID=A0A8S4BSK3_9TELE|nr:unnamed protein product [Menidia menidia]
MQVQKGSFFKALEGAQRDGVSPLRLIQLRSRSVVLTRQRGAAGDGRPGVCTGSAFREQVPLRHLVEGRLFWALALWWTSNFSMVPPPPPHSSLNDRLLRRTVHLFMYVPRAPAAQLPNCPSKTMEQRLYSVTGEWSGGEFKRVAVVTYLLYNSNLTLAPLVWNSWFGSETDNNVIKCESRHQWVGFSPLMPSGVSLLSMGKQLSLPGSRQEGGQGKEKKYIIIKDIQALRLSYLSHGVARQNSAAFPPQSLVCVSISSLCSAPVCLGVEPEGEDGNLNIPLVWELSPVEQLTAQAERAGLLVGAALLWSRRGGGKDSSSVSLLAFAPTSCPFISGYFQDVRGKERRACKAGRCLAPPPLRAQRCLTWCGCEIGLRFGLWRRPDTPGVKRLGDRDGGPIDSAFLLCQLFKQSRTTMKTDRIQSAPDTRVSHDLTYWHQEPGTGPITDIILPSREASFGCPSHSGALISTTDGQSKEYRKTYMAFKRKGFEKQHPSTTNTDVQTPDGILHLNKAEENRKETESLAVIGQLLWDLMSPLDWFN